jgi:hypothetical protein
VAGFNGGSLLTCSLNLIDGTIHLKTMNHAANEAATPNGTPIRVDKSNVSIAPPKNGR